MIEQSIVKEDHSVVEGHEAVTHLRSLLLPQRGQIYRDGRLCSLHGGGPSELQHRAKIGQLRWQRGAVVKMELLV